MAKQDGPTCVVCKVARPSAAAGDDHHGGCAARAGLAPPGTAFRCTEEDLGPGGAMGTPEEEERARSAMRVHEIDGLLYRAPPPPRRRGGRPPPAELPAPTGYGDLAAEAEAYTARVDRWIAAVLAIALVVLLAWCFYRCAQ